jgi:hypothetical protein
VDVPARALTDLIQTMVRDVIKDEVERAVAKLALADIGERLYTIPVAAQRLGISATSVRRHIAEYRLKVTMVPGRVPGSSERRIRGVDLDAFVVGLAGESGATTPGRRARAPRPKRQRSGTPPRLTELVEQYRHGA